MTNGLWVSHQPNSILLIQLNKDDIIKETNFIKLSEKTSTNYKHLIATEYFT